MCYAYKHMMDKLTPEQRKECVFVWHSAPSDENGTDMRAVCKHITFQNILLYLHTIIGGAMNDE